MIKSILIDATHFGTMAPTGVEAYVDALLPLLSSRLLAAGVSVSWVGHGAKAPVDMPAGVAWLPSPHRPFWSQTLLPLLIRAQAPDLYFTPSGIPPVAGSVRTAFTVHDLGAYERPASYTVGQRLRLKSASLAAARKAVRIIVPSAYTQERIQFHWKIHPDKVAVIPEAYLNSKVAPEAIKSLDDDRPYFLYIGRIEEKKELAPLVEGFAALHSSYRLVLAGKDGYGAGRIHALARSFGPDASIVFPGYISAGQKEWLFARAAACLVPCPVEGFGLPVLEAFAHGVPAVCVKAGALPEVAGNAARYVSFPIPSAWQEALGAFEKDPAAARQLAQAGSKRLALFSWEETAKKTADSLLTV